MADIDQRDKYSYKLFYLQAGVIMLVRPRHDEYGATVLREGLIERLIPWEEMESVYTKLDEGRFVEVPKSAEFDVRSQFSAASTRAFENKRYEQLNEKLDENLKAEILRGNLPVGPVANIEAAKLILRHGRSR